MRHSTLAFAMFLLAGCGSDLIENPNVQRWCADRPCGWEARGVIERVSSWHSHDYALSFVSDDARLSQLNPEAGTHGERCFSFTMVAKIDPGVRMFLELDFFDDGAVEFDQMLPETHFEKLRFLVTPPRSYRGVRFILRKDGPGLAVLAELHAEVSYDCVAPPVTLLPRPDGIECERNEDCRSLRCNSGRCGGCFDGRSCSDGKVCGVELVRTDYVELCVEPGSDAFGDRCITSDECASGICCNGACSECCTLGDCGAKVCARPSDFPAQVDEDHPAYWPSLCDPGSRARAPGELCASDEDCASLKCNAEQLRGCEVDCAADTGGACFSPCVTKRVYGGTCE